MFFQLINVVANLAEVYPKDEDALAGGVDDTTKLSYLHELGSCKTWHGDTSSMKYT